MLSEKEYQNVIASLQNGDSDALSILYDNYGGALYGVIFRIVRTPSSANELLQDTFLKIWQNRNTYNPQTARLYTWMSTIARNLSINYVNSKDYKQQAKVQGADNLVYLHDKTHMPVEALDIKGNVCHLENKYQEVIEYIYFRGYTHQEMSDELNMPLGTVKSRLKIAIRELRKIYDYRLLEAIMILIPIVKINIL